MSETDKDDARAVVEKAEKPADDKAEQPAAAAAEKKASGRQWTCCYSAATAGAHWTGMLWCCFECTLR